jgi:hypothetical protein
VHSHETRMFLRQRAELLEQVSRALAREVCSSP